MSEPVVPSWRPVNDEPQTVVGVDPGPDPGMVVLLCQSGRLLRVDVLKSEAALDDAMATAALVSLERFVIGRGTVRKTRGGTEATLDMIGRVKADAHRHGVRLVSMPAGAVKPWATNAKLKAWGALVPGDHHRDAARHALFAAVRAGILDRRPRP